jgi:hypothetical protein
MTTLSVNTESLLDEYEPSLIWSEALQGPINIGVELTNENLRNPAGALSIRKNVGSPFYKPNLIEASELAVLKSFQCYSHDHLNVPWKAVSHDMAVMEGIQENHYDEDGNQRPSVTTMRSYSVFKKIRDLNALLVLQTNEYLWLCANPEMQSRFEGLSDLVCKCKPIQKWPNKLFELVLPLIQYRLDWTQGQWAAAFRLPEQPVPTKAQLEEQLFNLGLKRYHKWESTMSSTGAFLPYIRSLICSRNIAYEPTLEELQTISYYFGLPLVILERSKYKPSLVTSEFLVRQKETQVNTTDLLSFSIKSIGYDHDLEDQEILASSEDHVPIWYVASTVKGYRLPYESSVAELTINDVKSDRIQDMTPVSLVIKDINGNLPLTMDIALLRYLRLIVKKEGPLEAKVLVEVFKMFIRDLIKRNYENIQKSFKKLTYSVKQGGTTVTLELNVSELNCQVFFINWLVGDNQYPVNLTQKELMLLLQGECAPAYKLINRVMFPSLFLNQLIRDPILLVNGFWQQLKISPENLVDLLSAKIAGAGLNLIDFIYEKAEEPLITFTLGGEMTSTNPIGEAILSYVKGRKQSLKDSLR